MANSRFYPKVMQLYYSFRKKEGEAKGAKKAYYSNLENRAYLLSLSMRHNIKAFEQQPKEYALRDYKSRLTSKQIGSNLYACGMR